MTNKTIKRSPINNKAVADICKKYHLTSFQTESILKASHLTADSRNVKQGSAFAALKGKRTDGHNYIKNILNKVSVFIISDSHKTDEFTNDSRKCFIKVPDPKCFLKELAPYFYDKPADKIFTIGVTGTNGKTTSVYMIFQMLKERGFSPGCIGTIEIMWKTKSIESSNTTPETCRLQEILFQMVKEGVDAVAMEVSSHAVSEDRIYGMAFDRIVMTNITEEHLDYHGTMENYLNAKMKLFHYIKPQNPYIIIWNDINDRNTIFNHAAKAVKTYSQNGTIIFYNAGAETFDQISPQNPGLYLYFQTKDIFKEGVSGTLSLFSKNKTGTSPELSVTQKTLFNGSLKTIGRYNLLNLTGAFAAAAPCCDKNISDFTHKTTDAVNFQKILSQGSKTRVPGRLENAGIPGGPLILIDYAHTPDALENVLTEIKHLPHKKLICIFGCGGDRDKMKRPLMGRISLYNADFTIITSDNPRSENPEKILDDIEKGMATEKKINQKKYIRIVSRSEAIREGIRYAGPKDILIIAGKGHETYQEINGKKFHFSDREEVKNTLNENSSNP